MKIATWNINSVRHRHRPGDPLSARPAARCAVPAGDQGDQRACSRPRRFRKLGYVHQAIHGQKAYHGVAVLSRLPFRETGVQDFCREGHARHMGVTFENGVELHNFYVPAGGDIPDPKAQ